MSRRCCRAPALPSSVFEEPGRNHARASGDEPPHPLTVRGHAISKDCRTVPPSRRQRRRSRRPHLPARPKFLRCDYSRLDAYERPLKAGRSVQCSKGSGFSPSPVARHSTHRDDAVRASHCSSWSLSLLAGAAWCAAHSRGHSSIEAQLLFRHPPYLDGTDPALTYRPPGFVHSALSGPAARFIDILNVSRSTHAYGPRPDVKLPSLRARPEPTFRRAPTPQWHEVASIPGAAPTGHWSRLITAHARSRFPPHSMGTDTTCGGVFAQ